MSSDRPPIDSGDPSAPKSFSEFVGQAQAIKLLKLEVEAARREHRSLSHLLLYGPPGTGKSSLAYVLAHEMGNLPMYQASGAELVTQKDTYEVLRRISGWPEGPTIVLLDEIDGVSRVAFYPFHGLMTTQFVTYNGTQYGPWPLTVIGTTNRTSGVPKAIRSRFRLRIFVGFYSVEDLTTIARMNARRRWLRLTEEVARYLAENSGGEPRKVLHLLHTLQLLGPSSGESTEKVREAMEMVGLHPLGLSELQYQYLVALRDAGGSAGLETVTATIFGDIADIKEEVEPWLLHSKMVRVDRRGRIILPAGVEYLQSQER